MSRRARTSANIVALSALFTGAIIAQIRRHGTARRTRQLIPVSRDANLHRALLFNQLCGGQVPSRTHPFSSHGIVKANVQRKTGMEWEKGAVMRRVSTVTISLVFLVFLILTVAGNGVAIAAPRAFADPAFGAQWQAGEAITPNFWGAAVTGGGREPYGSGTRLVQYFDKGRMELGADKGVTNGLLATELVSGKRQVGDVMFEMRQPAAIPIAGDATNTGPTYAQMQANAAQLLTGAVMSAPETPVTRLLDGTGKLGTTAVGGSDPQAIAMAYDATMQHNLPTAFARYRATAGIPVIGLAIAEPFWTNVKVGGKDTDVLVQAFERRVLTYTPGNADPYKVEMGNIGQHYSRWLIASAASTASATPVVPASPSAGATMQPPVSPTVVTMHGPLNIVFSALPRFQPGMRAMVTILTAPDASCSIVITQNLSVLNDSGLQPKVTDTTGHATWSWQPDQVSTRTGGSSRTDATVTCMFNGETARASAIAGTG